MADSIVGGRADQGIQQFVNQSPWDWAPVRRRLAQYVSAFYRPEAWVVDELVLPKNGSSSAGVGRQYAPSAGRVLNCQLGLGTFLVGEGVTPVNWRLMLPPEWGTHHTRRARAHIPDDERPRSRWQYVIDAVDEMTTGWEFDPAPIVVDARHDIKVEPLLRALEDRDLHYVVRVAAGTPVGTDLIGGQLASMIGRNGSGSTSLKWLDVANGPGSTSRFIIQAPPRQNGASSAWWRNRTRYLLAEWEPGQKRPSGIWLTDLIAVRLPQLIGLARTHRRTAAEMTRLSDSFGLAHFEGRSFRGWHHHATLVSLAHTYALTQALQDSRDRMGSPAQPAYA